MSRLIDADKLISDIEKLNLELFEEFKYADSGGMKITSNAQMYIICESVLPRIKEQPTAFDIDDILRQCKDKAIQLMNKQYNEDEYHMFSKGVQAMYLGLEKIIKENKIYSEIDVDMCINCTKSKYSNQGRPYCAKEERHLDSFNYKPDWCPLKEGGIE